MLETNQDSALPNPIQTRPLERCRRDLDFQPEKLWPSSLPVFCLADQLLCGFDRHQGEAISLPNTSLATALKSVYPELSFPELARLSQKTPQDPQHQQELWSHYGYRWKDSLAEVAHQLTTLPLSLQFWIQNKKMGPQDLAPFRSLKRTADLARFWPLFETLNPSKSDGIKIFEYLIELYLMDTNRTDLEPALHGDATQWLKQLQKARYPNATTQDHLGEQKTKSLAWPLKSEARWQRRGDRSGIELKLFFSHPQELKRSLLRLEQICTDLETNPEYEDLWSKN